MSDYPWNEYPSSYGTREEYLNYMKWREQREREQIQKLLYEALRADPPNPYKDMEHEIEELL